MAYSKQVVCALGGVGTWWAIHNLCNSSEVFTSMTQEHKNKMARIVGAIITSIPWSPSSQKLLLSAIIAQECIDIAENIEKDNAFRTAVLFGSHTMFMMYVYFKENSYMLHPSYIRVANAFTRHADSAYKHPNDAMYYMLRLIQTSVKAGSRFAALSLVIKYISCKMSHTSLPPPDKIVTHITNTTLRTTAYCFITTNIVSLAHHLRVPLLGSFSILSLMLIQPKSKWRSYIQFVYMHQVYSVLFAPRRKLS
jgi:hypothetical protein